MVVVYIVLVLLVIGYLALKLSGSKALYSDKGIASKVFVDPVSRLRAKPDRIEGDIDDAELLEFKARAKVVYPSDIAQVYVGVLAARAEGINVTSAAVYTGSGKKTAVRLGDNEFILKRIRKPLAVARLVASGGEPQATPKKVKCRSCGYNRACPHAL